MPGKCAWCLGGCRELSGAAPEHPACSSRSGRAHLSVVTVSPAQVPRLPCPFFPGGRLCQEEPQRQRGGRPGYFCRWAWACGQDLGLRGCQSREARTGTEGCWPRPAPQRCPAQAVAVHGDQGAATLGHLVLRAPGHPAGLHTLRLGALGLGHAGRGEDPPLPPRVALLPVQVGTGGWGGAWGAGPA